MFWLCMHDVDVLFEEMEKVSLPLKDSATNLVSYRGTSKSSIVFIGEAPGKNEDEQGLPFVGRSGSLLDEAISESGLKSFYITNIVKYRPPKNRNPYVKEMRSHGEWLWKELDILNPKFVVPLGNTATKFLVSSFEEVSLSSVDGISELRGKVITAENFSIFPTFHPAATMYDREKRPVFFEDISRLSDLLDE